MKTVCGFYTLSLKQMGGRKPFSEPRRARTRTETTSVLLYSVYKFENHLYIFYTSIV